MHKCYSWERGIGDVSRHQELDLVACDTACLERKPLIVWTEHLLWCLRADRAIEAGVPLPVSMADDSCPWRLGVTAALWHRNIRRETVCVASTLARPRRTRSANLAEFIARQAELFQA